MRSGDPRGHAGLPPVEVRLSLTGGGQRARGRMVAQASDDQLLRGKSGYHLRSVLGHHDLLLDTGRRPAVRRWPERLQREDHPLLDHDRVVE